LNIHNNSKIFSKKLEDYITKTQARKLCSQKNLELWLGGNLIKTTMKGKRIVYCEFDIIKQNDILLEEEKEKALFIGPLPFISKRKGKCKVQVTDFQTLKVPLKNITKDVKINDVSTIDKINSIVINCNKIVIHSLQLLKLYFIYLYDNNEPFPEINKEFIMILFKICSGRNLGDKYNHLINFYKEHYLPIQGETFGSKNLDQTMTYMAIGIVTDINNNLSMRFPEYVNRYINVHFNKKEVFEDIKINFKTKKERHREKYSILQKLKKIKNAMLSNNLVLTEEERKSIDDEDIERWIEKQKIKVYKGIKFEKCLKYDLKKYPQNYLRGMFYMMRKIENNKDKCEKLLNLFPLRTDIIPKYIKFDTVSVVALLLPTKSEGVLENQKTKQFYKLNIVDYQREIWSLLFKIEKKVFNMNPESDHKYTFHFMIETDGVGASIILRKKEKEIVFKPFHKEKFKENYTSDGIVPQLTSLETFKKVVGIDPNKSDLIFCSDENNITFRYTQNQRRKETKTKRFRDILQHNKKVTKVLFQRNISCNENIIIKEEKSQNIEEVESVLSFYNKKTLDFNSFKEYIKNKNEVNNVLNNFYQNKLYRKQKLCSFILRNKSEQRMLNKFKEKYGKPENVVIGFGDYDQKRHMKFKEPVKGKGFRNLFRKAGYEVFLVDEYRTSCKCSDCKIFEGVCETFRKRENPRPWRNDIIKVHGLVKCKTCSRLWNRDVNASRNICKIAFNELRGLERPPYLSRSNIPDLSGLVIA